MIQSVFDDIKSQLRYGNMITRIIFVNTFVILFVAIVKAFTPPSSTFFNTMMEYLALNSDTFKWLTRPWTFISHMFLHEGFWHYAWNMIMLYWFGRIVGDLIGDKKILPLYLIGGFMGAFFYIIFVNIVGFSGIAYGASGAVMCFVMASAFLAPEYNMRLLLIGNIRLKYVALGLVAIDILTNLSTNPGGTFAHIGGAFMGGLYVHYLQKGQDFAGPFQVLFERITQRRKPKKKEAPMKVVFNRKRKATTYDRPSQRSEDTQEQIDQILDKINVSGYDSLTKEEKDSLYRASKDN